MARHCQCCGHPEGEPQIIVERRRRKNEHDKLVMTKVRIETPPVRLNRTSLADYGDRLCCPECLQAVHDANVRLIGDHLTLSNKG